MAIRGGNGGYVRWARVNLATEDEGKAEQRVLAFTFMDDEERGALEANGFNEDVFGGATLHQHMLRERSQPCCEQDTAPTSNVANAYETNSSKTAPPARSQPNPTLPNPPLKDNTFTSHVPE